MYALLSRYSVMGLGKGLHRYSIIENKVLGNFHRPVLRSLLILTLSTPWQLDFRLRLRSEII